LVIILVVLLLCGYGLVSLQVANKPFVRNHTRIETEKKNNKYFIELSGKKQKIGEMLLFQGFSPSQRFTEQKLNLQMIQDRVPLPLHSPATYLALKSPLVHYFTDF